MKTHIIQLEQHDDLISVRDKMSWAKAPRILLVWPARRQVNLRPLDMVLLLRHATSLGAVLGIASRSSDVRRSAVEAGIPAFRSSAEAQKEEWSDQIPGQYVPRWRRRKKPLAKLARLREAASASEPPWTKNPYGRIGVFSAGVMAVLVIFVLFLPSATVRLHPVTQTQSVTLPVRIDPKSKAVSITGVVPAHLASISVEGEENAPATGRVTVPETRASGDVRFTNLTQSPVQVPAGTIVRTVGSPAVRFEVARSAQVPAGVGQTLIMPVRAVEAGVAGNLSANTLQAIEGSLGLDLTVTNPGSMAGGSDVEKMVPSPEDRSKLLARVADLLLKKAQAGITQQIPQGGYLLSKTLTGETLSEKYDPPDNNTPASGLSLALNQEYHAYYIAQGDLMSLGELVLDASLPVGFAPVSETLSVSPVGEPRIASDGSVTWQIRANRQIAAEFNQLDIMSRVLGRTPYRAIKELSALKLASAPDITLSPPWWFWLPPLPLRIKLETAP